MELASETECSFDDDLSDIDRKEGIVWALEEDLANSWVGCRVTRTILTKKGRKVPVTDVRIGKV